MTIRMSAKPQKKTEPGTAAHKDVFNVSGVLLEFLASPPRKSRTRSALSAA